MPRGTKESVKKKSTAKRARNREKNIQKTKDDKFSFDEEIVIGLKRLDEPEDISKKVKNKNGGRTGEKNSRSANKKGSSRSNNRSRQNEKNNRKKNAKSNEIIDVEYEDNIIIQSKYMQNYEDDAEKRNSGRRNKHTQANSNRGRRSQAISNSNKRIQETQRGKDNKSRQRAKQNNGKRQQSMQKSGRVTSDGERLQTVNINTPLSEEEIKRREKSRKKRKLVLKVIKWITILAIIIGGTIYAMLSPIFNIKEVEVLGNSKISSETIISLSGITIDQNMFSFRTSDVSESIKQNAYIDTVDIHRDLPDKISIVVSERKTTYMIKFGNAYAYINNQGYILEITNQEVAVPILTGYETPDENIKEGNRLDTADLERLNDVLKIMEAASSSGNNLKNLITQIDMSDKSNYILNLQTQKKQIYFGDATNLSTKMLWIDQILEEEKKNEGILYLNMDLNTDRPYFREKV